jgi:hypothetical protein
MEGTPHEKRRGRLRNDNPSGDFSKAARCGAKNRCGGSCQCPAMPNGRCRLHGGLSTGPRTPEGIERIRKAVSKHTDTLCGHNRSGASFTSYCVRAETYWLAYGLLTPEGRPGLHTIWRFHNTNPRPPHFAITSVYRRYGGFASLSAAQSPASSNHRYNSPGRSAAFCFS